MQRIVGDLGAVLHAATIVVGDQLGLYKALAKQPTSAEDLARSTETDPRICANGSRRRRQAVMSSTTRRAAGFQ